MSTSFIGFEVSSGQCAEVNKKCLRGTGEPWEIKKAVCLHEEDAGIMWKHMEYRNGHAEVRRSRRLVLSFVATVVNYE